MLKYERWMSEEKSMKFLPQFPKAVAPLLLCAASLAWAQAPADAAASAPAADAEAVTPKMAPFSVWCCAS